MTAFIYSDGYIETLFQAWYATGAPSINMFHSKIKEDPKLHDELGRCPTVITLQNWFEEKGFYARKDLLDARVATQIDDDLVALKVNALREQAALFRQVRQKAAQHLLENEFDSSSSAVNAFIKASQEERVALGISRTIEKMSQMDDDGLLAQVKELAAKVSGEILDADDVPDDEEKEE